MFFLEFLLSGKSLNLYYCKYLSTIAMNSILVSLHNHHDLNSFSWWVVQWRCHCLSGAFWAYNMWMADGGTHEQEAVWCGSGCALRSSLCSGWTWWTVIPQQCGEVRSFCRSVLFFCLPFILRVWRGTSYHHIEIGDCKWLRVLVVWINCLSSQVQYLLIKYGNHHTSTAFMVTLVCRSEGPNSFICHVKLPSSANNPSYRNHFPLSGTTLRQTSGCVRWPLPAHAVLVWVWLCWTASCMLLVARMESRVSM